MPDVRAAFELVGAHLDKARKDSDYKFVLAEVDYLKPYFDAYPQDRQDLRALLADGRVEIVGGNYNEPNTNLIGPEAIIRNAVHGIGFQRDVFGGDPRSAWMLDAFGFDPGYPGLMAAAGLSSSAWARGPFHQWGPAGPFRSMDQVVANLSKVVPQLRRTLLLPGCGHWTPSRSGPRRSTWLCSTLSGGCRPAPNLSTVS